MMTTEVCADCDGDMTENANPNAGDLCLDCCDLT